MKPEDLPSGKLTNEWEIATINRTLNYKWAIFNSKLLVYQRVVPFPQELGDD